MLMIGCVEPNPWPLTPTKHTDEPREHHSDSSSSIHKESSGLPRECAEKKKAARRALRRYRKTNKDHDKQTYFEQRKEYKALLQSKQKQFKQDRVNKLESSMKDSRDFWGEIRKCRLAKTIHGNISTESWRHHFF